MCVCVFDRGWEGMLVGVGRSEALEVLSPPQEYPYHHSALGEVSLGKRERRII